MYQLKFGSVQVEGGEITFTDLDRKRFEYLFHGLIITGNIIAQKGLSTLKKEISVLDKLEDISRPCNCGKYVPGTKEPDRELFSHRLELSDEEFDLLHNYIGNVPWSIGNSAREALRTMDWLKSCKV